MHAISRVICWFTLWVDASLVVGVLFTGKIGSVSISAMINVGSPISSADPGGKATICLIAGWTSILAVGWLRATRQGHSLSLLSKDPNQPLSPTAPSRRG